MRIGGIYDVRTVDALSKQNISSFHFDFRAKSFNFLQHYRALEIIEKKFQSDQSYFFQFENEHPDLINKYLADLKKTIGVTASEFENLNLFLEFSDNKIHDDINFPYFLHYSSELKFSEIRNAKNLKGLVLNYGHLEDLNRRGQFENFLSIFLQNVPNGFRLILDCDWDSFLSPSILEYLDFEIISYPINSKVEVCYRNVDIALVEKEIRIISNELGQM